jgi:hypothetical protein
MPTFNEIFDTLNSKSLPVQGRKCLVKYNDRMLIGRMLDTRFFDIEGDYQGEDSPEQKVRMYQWSSDKSGVFLCIPKLDYSFGGNYFSLEELPHGMSLYFKTAENLEFRNVIELLDEYTLEPPD